MKLSSSLRVILGLLSLSLVCQAEDDFDKGKITIGLCENRKFMREKRRMIAIVYTNSHSLYFMFHLGLSFDCLSILFPYVAV